MDRSPNLCSNMRRGSSRSPGPRDSGKQRGVVWGSAPPGMPAAEVEDVGMSTITQVHPDRAQVSPDRLRCRIAPSALALLESARHGLSSAEGDMSAGSRYVGAHLAALRAAAAIVAARAEPAPQRRRRPASVWELLPRVEPTLSEWAPFFAPVAGTPPPAHAALPPP